MIDMQKYHRRSNAGAVILAALCLVLITGSVQTGPPRDGDKPDATIGVVYADGRQTEDVPLYRVDDASVELFMSAFDLARIFRATKYWNPGARRLMLRIDIHSYQFTLDTRLVVVDEETILLRVPVRYHEGSVMIPLEFISEILAPRSLEKVELDEERKVLTIGSPEYNVTDLRFVDAEDGTRAVLDLTEDLFDNILRGNHTRGSAKLIHYQGNAFPIFDKTGQKFVHRESFGDNLDGFQVGFDPFRLPEKVFGVHIPDHIVNGIAVDQDPAES